MALPLETSIFLNAYKARADVNAIAHLFPPYATAYSARGKLFRLLTKSSQQILREVLKVECKECPSRFAGLCICNTDIRTSYSGVRTLLLKENGIITLGSDLDEALNLARLVEQTSKINYIAANNQMSI
jgi:L-fuculose-phosphate aldolase